MTELLAPLLAAFAVLAAPGPTNALLAAAGAASDRPAPLRAVGAVVLGYAVSVTALRLVGAPLVEALPMVGPLLRLAFAAWLVYLGCCLWRDDAAITAGAVVDRRRLLIATLLNPKGAVFAFVLFPDGASGGALLAWSLGLAVAIALSAGLWYHLGDRVRRHGGHRAAGLMPRLAAIVLVAIASTVAATTVVGLV